MTLSPEQKQAVSAWVAAGDNLSQVQKKLAEQFKVSMTYMDVRFLVDDLGLELKNAAPKADASDVTKAAAQAGAPRAAAAEKKGLVDKTKENGGVGAVDEDADMSAPDFVDDAAGGPPVPPAGPGGVVLDVDRIVRPGAVVSGTVTFSDGVSGKWALDQMGRLMLETPQKGYQPSPADVQSFQVQLQAQLQRHGY